MECVECRLGAETTLQDLLSSMDADMESDLMMYIAQQWGIDVSEQITKEFEELYNC